MLRPLRKTRHATGLCGVGLVAATVLGGCAGGIQAGGVHPKIEFIVAATHEAVYRRATEYVRVCHENSTRSLGMRYVATRVLNVQGNRAELRVHPSTRPRELLEIITVAPYGMGDAVVNATVLGQKEWDQAELQALQQSIESATPLCRTSPGP